MDRIEPDKRVHGLQGALTPLVQHRDDLVRHGADRGFGKLHAIDFLDMLGNLGVTVAQGVEGENFVLDGVTEVGLVLFDDLGLEGAVTVSGNGELELAGLAFDAFGTSAVFTVTDLLGEMTLQLGLQSRLGQLFDQGCQYPVFPLDGNTLSDQFQRFIEIELLHFVSLLLDSVILPGDTKS